jgi:eukaryotic-like serine/threonine-protein kinase
MSSQSPSPSDSTPDVAGRMAGEYRLGRKLGEGGFGAVYEAEHPVLRRRAAVKVLHQVAGMDSDAVLRFVSEAQAASQIRSRHIVDIFSFGKLPNGRHFYVMDLLDGHPLDRYLRHVKRCDVVTTLQLLRPIAEALDAAHAAGVVHRDLKPQNMFLAWEQSGETVPKLLDFGMAKLLGESSVHTVSGVPIGTPLYMSPEQARGEKVDGRSDVYALGVVCHEMLSGQVPFSGESPLAVLMAHLTLPPPRLSQVCPDLPPELDEALLHMLAKDAAGRPTTAGEAIAELTRAAESAGFVVPAGIPHLPRPAVTVVAYPGGQLFDTEEPFSNRARGPSARRTDDPSDPAALLARTDRAPDPHARNWSFAALLVALAAGALYLGSSALRASGTAAPSSVTASSAINSMAAPAAPPATSPAPSSVAAPLAPANGGAPGSESAAGAGATARSSSAAGSGSAAAPQPAPAQPAPAQPVEVQPAAPHSVQLLVRGAPAGARVWIGGKPVGEAPGPISVPFGEKALELRVTAAGHSPRTLSIKPERDQNIDVKLDKRAPRPKAPRAIPSDLENPF